MSVISLLTFIWRALIGVCSNISSQICEISQFPKQSRLGVQVETTMYGKTPITVLQEYCAKNSRERPEYTFMESSDGKSFGCRVDAIGSVATGEGRPKKEAKHDAAANILKKLKLDHPGIDDIPQAPHEQIPMSDAIVTLRDWCLQKDHPLPNFEVVRQSGSPEAPEFEGAKQLAAQKLIEILQAAEVEEHEKQVVLLDESIKYENENLQKKIKTYREYKKSDNKIVPGMLLGDTIISTNSMMK